MWAEEALLELGVYQASKGTESIALGILPTDGLPSHVRDVRVIFKYFQ